MDLLARRTVGISIESTSLRLVGVKSGRIEWWAELPGSHDEIVDGVIRQPERVGERLSHFFIQQALPKSRIVLAISAARASTRLLAVPVPETTASIEVEARRQLPELETGATLHWQAVDRTGDLKRVFAAAVPDAPVQAALQMMSFTGQRPVAVDLRPLACYQALPYEHGVIALVDGLLLELLIVVNDLPVFLRSVPLGGRGSLLSQICEESARAIRFYADTNRSAPLLSDAPIVLAGDVPDDPGLIANLEALTGHPVVAASPPLDAPDDFPAGRFFAAAGLCLKRG